MFGTALVKKKDISYGKRKHNRTKGLYYLGFLKRFTHIGFLGLFDMKKQIIWESESG